MSGCGSRPPQVSSGWGATVTVSRSRTCTNWLMGSFGSDRHRGTHFWKCLGISWVPKYRCGREVWFPGEKSSALWKIKLLWYFSRWAPENSEAPGVFWKWEVKTKLTSLLALWDTNYLYWFCFHPPFPHGRPQAPVSCHLSCALQKEENLSLGSCQEI